MYQVLVTTIKVDAVHTIVIQFNSEGVAQKAIATINENGGKPSTPYGQKALRLW